MYITGAFLLIFVLPCKDNKFFSPEKTTEAVWDIHLISCLALLPASHYLCNKPSVSHSENQSNLSSSE